MAAFATVAPPSVRRLLDDTEPLLLDKYREKFLHVRRLPDDTEPLLLDKYCEKYSLKRRPTRATDAERQRHRRDLQKAIEEIDGLMAGFQYLDGVDPGASEAGRPPPSTPHITSQPPWPSASWTNGVHLQDMPPASQYSLQDFEADLLPVEMDIPTPPVTPVPDPQPMPSQWADIRNLRGEIDFHHKRFQKLAAKSNNPALCSLMETFPTAESVRKSGIDLFRDILSGFKPGLLEDVFAFASLSYAMSQQLLKRGRIQKKDILAGLGVWRDGISDPLQRAAFEMLAVDLWPEAIGHLHLNPVYQRAAGDDTPFAGLSGADAKLPDVFGQQQAFGYPPVFVEADALDPMIGSNFGSELGRCRRVGGPLQRRVQLRRLPFSSPHKQRPRRSRASAPTRPDGAGALGSRPRPPGANGDFTPEPGGARR